MHTILNLITNKIVYILSNQRSRVFGGRKGYIRVAKIREAPARWKTRDAENSRESKAKNYLPGFHIFQATGGLENLIDL